MAEDKNGKEQGSRTDELRKKGVLTSIQGRGQGKLLGAQLGGQLDQ